MSANLKEAVAAGLIETGHSLAPSICLTDLEVIFEVLDSQTQRIHYLARRAELERTMRYHGDEMDLLGFYVETGFNIGDVEDGATFIDMAMKSKELDPYFVARADGVDVRKPALRLTSWWKDILERIENMKGEFWTETAYIFLNVQFEDQKKCERQFERLADRIEAGRVQNKHNWMVFIRGTRSKRQYAILVYPYTTRDRNERNAMMKHMAADTGEKVPAIGIAVMGLDLNALHYPYNVLAYVPVMVPVLPRSHRYLTGPVTRQRSGNCAEHQGALRACQGRASAERSEGSLVHAQALPDNLPNGVPDRRTGSTGSRVDCASWGRGSHASTLPSRPLGAARH